MRGFRWTASGGMVELPAPHGGNTQARAVTGDGSIVIGSANNAEGLHRAARWAGTSNPEFLGELSPTADWEAAAGVSADGTVAVGNSLHFDQDSRAVRWSLAGS